MTELSLNGGKFMYVGPSIPTGAAKAIQDAINLAHEIREREYATKLADAVAKASIGLGAAKAQENSLGSSAGCKFTFDPKNAYVKQPQTPEAKADDAKAQKTMSDFTELLTKEYLEKEKERLQKMRADMVGKNDIIFDPTLSPEEVAHLKDVIDEEKRRCQTIQSEIAKRLLESVRNAPQIGKMFAMPSELKLGDDGPGPTFEAMPKWAMGAGSALHGFETMNAPETIATPAPGDIVLVKGQSGLADGLYVVGPLGEFVPHPQGFMPMSKPKFILKCTRKIELEGSECGVDFQMPIINLSQQATVSLKGLTKAEIDEFTVGESYRLQFKPVPRKPEPAPDRDYTPSMFGDDRPGKGTRPFDESQDIRDYGKGK